MIQVKLFGEDPSQYIVQKFKLNAETFTELEVKAGFKVRAALLNSGNLGYARVLLDDQSTSYFLEKIGSIEDQLDRSYVWMILRDHVKLCKVSPSEYIECFVKNMGIETDQMTLTYLTANVEFILGHFLKNEQVQPMKKEVFRVLFEKVKTLENQSLRNLLINNALRIADISNKDYDLVKCMREGSI